MLLRVGNLFDLHFLYLTLYSTTVTLLGLLKPVVLFVHVILVARMYANLWPLFPIIDVKIGQIRELKVREEDLPK